MGSEQIVRFAEIPKAAHPLPIYSGDPPEAIPARWGAISIAAASDGRRFLLYLLAEDGQVLEALQWESMRMALDQARSLIGLNDYDWSTCEVDVPASGSIDPAVFRTQARLTEREFWTRLEYRVSHELSGVPENHLRFLWSDGFWPREFVHDGEAEWILGRASIVNGDHEDMYEFRLRIGPGVRQADVIDWSSLLPDKAHTGWLSIDTERKILEIDGTAAR